jgi:LCP family protein required for cell wall assembly
MSDESDVRTEGRDASDRREPDDGSGAPGDADAPSGRTRRHRTGSQRAILVTGVAAVLGIALLVAAVVFVAAKLGNIERDDVKVDAAQDGGPMNIVVVGSDSRDDISNTDTDASAFLGTGGDAPTGQRSDTIMIVRIDPQADHVDMLSLPRDLWLPLAGSTDNSRLNEAYSQGTQKLIDTIKQDFGIDINHYVEVNFKGFEGVVDAIGGVPMYFDKPMRDTFSGLKIDQPGCQTLNGQQALGFARARHLQYNEKNVWKDDPTGDLGRIARQQFFLRTLFEHASKSAVTPDLRVAGSLLDATTKNLKVDKSFDLQRMAEIGKRFASFNSDQIHTYSLPVTPYTTGGGGSVVRVSADVAQPILNLFRGLPDDALPPSAIKATVAGSTKPGSAADASAALKSMEFNIVAPPTDGSVTAPATPPKRTAIRYPEGSQRLATEIARHLTAGADVVEDKTIHDFTLVLTVGADYAGTTATPRPAEEATALPTSTAVPGATSTTLAGSKANGAAAKTSPSTTSASSSTTTSTEMILGGTDAIGIVPGKPPAGVTCG